jgi:hypothetical protein
VRLRPILVLASLPLSLSVSLACNDSGTQLVTDSGGVETFVDGASVPDPGSGNQVDIAFKQLFPDDTPGQATPLGTSTMSDVTVWITDNMIGGTGNASNYFVFRSGPATGTFIFRGCFDSPITGMTAGLWRVVDGKQQTPPVGTATSTPDGPTMQCLVFDQSVLAPDTVYLFGLTATGGAGLYSL